MNIGIDFHDTISYNPKFFRELMGSWVGSVYIVTGTPMSKKEETIEQLEEIGISRNLYKDILMGFEYEKVNMTMDHFHRMKKHKLKRQKGFWGNPKIRVPNNDRDSSFQQQKREGATWWHLVELRCRCLTQNPRMLTTTNSHRTVSY